MTAFYQELTPAYQCLAVYPRRQRDYHEARALLHNTLKGKTLLLYNIIHDGCRRSVWTRVTAWA